MSVILNESALAALLETEEGPVGLFVQRTAARVVEQAQQNVRDYFGTAPSLHGRVDQEIEAQMEGSTAVIGIRDGGSKSQRIARYQAEGRFNWLTRALEAARE